MNKIKMSIKKIAQYLRELSVVVIGVAITLFASNWISIRNEKKNLSLFLNSIKIELEGNAESFENYAKRFQKSVKYANYIRAHDEKSINQDTIWYYASSTEDSYGWGIIQSAVYYRKDAFDMFKTSGAMRQMIDKNLLVSISGTYNTMENVQIFLDMCFQQKREESTREWNQRAEGKSITIPMQRFYSNDLPHAMVRQCAEMSELIKETLSKLEQTKMVK